MKVLIWIGCVFVATILNTLLGYATGIKVGYVIFYFAVYFVAKKLCEKWDQYKEKKDKQKYDDYIAKRNSASIEEDNFCKKCGEKLIDNSKFCRKCGCENESKITLLEKSEDVSTNTINTSKTIYNDNCKKISNNGHMRDKLFIITTGISVVLSTIAAIATVVAMNIQDYERNYCENWNTTVVYVVLGLLFVAFDVLGILSIHKRKGFKYVFLAAVVLIIAAVIVSYENSIFSDRNWYVIDGDWYDTYYINNLEVDICNKIWFCCVFVIFAVLLLPVVKSVSIQITGKWHSSIKYREICYNRISKIQLK